MQEAECLKGRRWVGGQHNGEPVGGQASKLGSTGCQQMAVFATLSKIERKGNENRAS